MRASSVAPDRRSTRVTTWTWSEVAWAAQIRQCPCRPPAGSEGPRWFPAVHLLQTVFVHALPAPRTVAEDPPAGVRKWVFPSPPGATGHVRYPRGLGACIGKAVGRRGDRRGHAGGADDGRAAVRAPAIEPRQLVHSDSAFGSHMDYNIRNKHIWIQVCRHKHFPQPRSTARDFRDRLCARSFGLRSSGGSRSRNK